MHVISASYQTYANCGKRLVCRNRDILGVKKLVCISRCMSHVRSVKHPHSTRLYKRQRAFISGDIRYKPRVIFIQKMKDWVKNTWHHIPESMSHKNILPTTFTSFYSYPKKQEADIIVPKTEDVLETNSADDDIKKICTNETVMKTNKDCSGKDLPVTNLDDLLEKSVIIEENVVSKLDGSSKKSQFSLDYYLNTLYNRSKLPTNGESEDNKTNNNKNNSGVLTEKSKKPDDGFLQILARVYQIPISTLLRYRDNLPENVEEKRPIVRQDFISRADLVTRTVELVESMKSAMSNISQETRMVQLCKHLVQYPDCRSTAIKEGVLPMLLKIRDSNNLVLQAQARQGLSLVGYPDTPKGRGVRVLTIDGGGTRGLVAIESLKHLQQSCDTDIEQLFDYVCGVSTGALIAAMVFMYHVPLDECTQIYKDFSSKMFTQNRIVGTGQLMWNHAFYDTDAWQTLLRQYIGERLMIDSAKDSICPKISAVSCITNTTRLSNFIFRNYNLPPDALAQYPGNCKHRVWEVIRASSAAPGYYEEFKLGDFVHQDGGLFTNNPTALAIHECRLLWPEENLQTVVSLGTGQYEPNLEVTNHRSSLRVKITKVIDSATDTEAVHTMLQDLMPPSTYFRFNPYLSEEILLDEIRPEKWERIQKDAGMYYRKNDAKLSRLKSQILLKRQFLQSAADYLKDKIVRRK